MIEHLPGFVIGSVITSLVFAVKKDLEQRGLFRPSIPHDADKLEEMRKRVRMLESDNANARETNKALVSIINQDKARERAIFNAAFTGSFVGVRIKKSASRLQPEKVRELRFGVMQKSNEYADIFIKHHPVWDIPKPPPIKENEKAFAGPSCAQPAKT